jgi:hypothetical protein
MSQLCMCAECHITLLKETKHMDWSYIWPSHNWILLIKNLDECHQKEIWSYHILGMYPEVL